MLSLKKLGILEFLILKMKKYLNIWIKYKIYAPKYLNIEYYLKIFLGIYKYLHSNILEEYQQYYCRCLNLLVHFVNT